MKINREELLGILKAVRPGLAAKEIIEQSTSFIFRNGFVSTYNDEVMITHPLELNLEGAVQAQQFYNLLSKCKDENIDIFIKEKELMVKGKKFKAGIRLDAEISLPLDEIPVPSKKDFDPLPKKFTEAVKYCLFSAGTDMTNPVLTNIHILLPAVESTDTKRLTQYILDCKIDRDGSILLPARAAGELVNYPVTTYGRTVGWVHFKTRDDVIFSARTMEGKFPLVKWIIAMEGEPITFPSDMTEVLERAEVLSEVEITRARAVEIELSDGLIVVKSENKSGWYKEQFMSRYSGPTISFKVNSIFLKEILKHMRKAEIDEEGTRLKFTGDEFVHVIALYGKN